MPRKDKKLDDQRPDFDPDDKSVISKMYAAIREFGPRYVLDRYSSTRFLEWYHDHKWYGGVPEHKRAGYAIRQREMLGLAPGLFRAGHAYLRAIDLPSSQSELRALNSRLIVARASRDDKIIRDVATASKIATKMLGASDGISTLSEQCDAMWSLRDTHPETFTAGVLGDFPACQKFLPSMPLTERCKAVRALARQRIIWNSFDLHRVSAHSHRAVHHLIPAFMRPFLKNETTNSFINALLVPADAMEIQYQRVENAERLGLDHHRSYGPKQFAIKRVFEIDDNEDEEAPGLAELLRDERSDIRVKTAIISDELRAIRDDPEHNNQQTLHEWHFVLGDLAASYAVAYRVAEDEAAMVQILIDPTNHQALFDVNQRPFPRQADRAIHSRAIHLLAAYRAVFLAGPEYASEAVDDTEVAQFAGQAFWNRMSMANALSPKERRASELFDLSHWARAGSSGV